MSNTAQKAGQLPVGWQGVRFSFRHHILPPLLGLAFSALIYGLLNFPWLEAQGRYYVTRFSPVSNASSVAPVAPASASSELIVPSINVKAPVIYEASTNNATIAYDLRNGVVHYGSTALPGERGNVVIFGHSSGVAWAPGDYKFIFTLLNKLSPGQQITLHYQGTRYVYVVSGSQIVPPTDMTILNTNGMQSELSLVTCTPVGTSKNRLVVHAKQLYPNPAINKPFKPLASTVLSELPGN